MIEERKLNRAKRQQENKEKRMKQKNEDIMINGEKVKKKKQRKKPVGNKKRKRAKIELINGQQINAKKQKRMEHKLREFKHYQKEELLLKRLKRGAISQTEFDDEMGYKL